MAMQDYQQLANELRTKGISDERVLSAIAQTPRHLFIRPNLQPYSTEDTALPIDCEQTISQPYVVAKMTEIVLSAEHFPEKVLEIGTGSGYQAAILSRVVNEVFTIERIKALHQSATQLLEVLNLNNIHTLHSDGHLGWPEHAPYDAILVTAATAEIPKALLDQLTVGGQLVLPLGDTASQMITVITCLEEGFHRKQLDPVMFVPLLPGTR